MRRSALLRPLTPVVTAFDGRVRPPERRVHFAFEFRTPSMPVPLVPIAVVIVARAVAFVITPLIVRVRRLFPPFVLLRGLSASLGLGAPLGLVSFGFSASLGLGAPLGFGARRLNSARGLLKGEPSLIQRLRLLPIIHPAIVVAVIPMVVDQVHGASLVDVIRIGFDIGRHVLRFDIRGLCVWKTATE